MLRDSGFGKPEEHWPSKIAVLTCILVLMLAARNSPRCSGAAPRDPERTRGRLLREAFQEMQAQDFEALASMRYSASGRRLSFLASVPTGGDHVDEDSQNTEGMERSGNFWLSCDIKEA